MRFKADELIKFTGVRDPSLHILKAFLVSLFIRNVFYRRAALGYLDYLLSQIINSYLILVSDIKNLAHCLRFLY